MLHSTLMRPAVLLILFLLASAPLPAEVVSDSVRSALTSSDRVRVIISLREPERSPRKPGAWIAEVRAEQDDVLARRHPDSFALLERWDAIPAIAAEIGAREIESLHSDPDVLKVDLDEGGSGGLAQSIPLIKGDLVRGRGFTGRGVVVAVLDTGIDTTHPDLHDAIVAEQCFCRNSNGTGCCPNGLTEQSGPGAGADDHGHGTNVSGIIASSGQVAPMGVAPGVKLVAVKVMDRFNSFNASSQIVSGLNWLIMNRPDVRVVNMSLGTNARYTGACDNVTAFTQAFASAINTLRNRGVIVFASTGNDQSPIDIEAPACIEKTVAVAAVYDSNVGQSTAFCTDATTAPDKVTCFSNTSATLDLLAPGAPITSSGRGGRTSTFHGTSQASPHAAAAAAVLLEINALLTPDQIEDAIESTGIPVVDARNGLAFPRLDLDAAARLVTPPPPARRRAARR
ncbi:MAG TPA: S8 family serine peptidase [Thermoanaerobaculia bacterium]